MLWAAPPSSAVAKAGVFELDGDIAASAAPGYDWASLFNADGSRINLNDPAVLATKFLDDTALPGSTFDPTTFAGSNKDIENIPTWECGPSNNVSDKGDLLNAYAAIIEVPADAPSQAGQTVLYLGSERDSDNGTAFAGFWLVQDNNVGCVNGAFSGSHTNGDVLIVSDYVNGGSVNDVSVYRWDSSCGSADNNDPQPGQCADTNLRTVFKGSTCNANVTQDSCAISNNGTISSPWPPTSHTKNTFLETGIDMGFLSGSGTTCFTTFLAETRTSHSTDAELIDFAGGQFDTCPPPPITTTASGQNTLNAPGSAQTDTANLSAVGNKPVPTGSVAFYLCQPNQVTAGGCETGGTLVSTETLVNGSATSDPASGALTTPLGTYCWRAEYTPDQAAAGHYKPGSHTNATTECFTIVKGNPALNTQINVSISTGNVPGLGITTLGDTATLSGFLGSVAGETITFRLYGPYAENVAPTCTAAEQVFQTTGTLSAAGVATTSDTFTPTLAGRYTWVASYAGNPLNNPATHACGQANESVTVIGAQINVEKTGASPINAGDTISFQLTVNNPGSVPALNVVVTDNLPGNAGLNWTENDARCTISGAIGSQVLTCNLGTLAGLTTAPAITVSSPTTAATCGTINNTGKVDISNPPSSDTDPASVVVQCANISIDKQADDGVDAGTDRSDNETFDTGDTIGFNIVVTNSGAGAATNVTVTDELPDATGVVWTISPAVAGCSITGTAPDQVLNCTFAELAASATRTIHIQAATDAGDAGTYPNSACVSSPLYGTTCDPATIIVRAPDLTLDKTATSSSVNAGSPIGFTITLGNAGPGTAKNVVLNDPLPGGAGVDWSIASQTGTACQIAGTPQNETLSCSLDSLAADATYTVTLSSPTAFESCKAYPNTATAWAGNDPGATQGSPLTDSATVTVNCPNLTVAKTADDGIDEGTGASANETVNAGSQIGFTVTVSNIGVGTATGVTINDPLPGGAGVDWSISGPAGTCSISGSPQNETLVCTAFDLASNDSFSVHVVSATAFASCKVYNNTATAAAGNGGQPVTATASVTVQCPSLDIVKTTDTPVVDAGAEIHYSITVTNAGPGTATNVTISDPLPGGGNSNLFWSEDPDTAECTITSQVLNCSLGDMSAGASFTVRLSSATMFVDNGDGGVWNSCTPPNGTDGKYVNTATVSSTNHPNDTSSADIVVNCPDLSIVKTADAASVNAGENIGFTVTVSNSASAAGTAHGVTINDLLPAGSGINWSISPANDDCEITGAVGAQVLSCDVGDLAPGDSFSVHVTSPTSFVTTDAGTVNSCTPPNGGGDGDYDNTASFSSSNHPSEESSASVVVNCPNLSIVKTAFDGIDEGTGESDNETVDAGTAIGFTVTVSNAGPGVAKAVQISDPLPAGTNIDWALVGAPAGCSISGAVGSEVLNCTVGDLAAGASFTVRVTSTTAFGSAGTYPNEATATSTNHPTVKDPATVVVRQPALTIVKEAGADTVSAGEEISFTITVTNSGAEGTGIAKGATLDDPLPVGTGISWTIDSQASGGTIADGPDDLCAIAEGTLSCELGDLPAGASYTVTIVSPTTGKPTCSNATYTNAATVGATNHPELEAVDSVTVECPNIIVVKEADEDVVNTGSPVGFTITVTNTLADGTGRAINTALSDNLPSGEGVEWTIVSETFNGEPADPALCSIDVADGAQVLNCAGRDLAAGDSFAVQVVSNTSFASCGPYPNTATASGDNHPDVSDSAETEVICPALDANLVRADEPVEIAGNTIGFTLSGRNTSDLLAATQSAGLQTVSLQGFTAATMSTVSLLASPTPGTVTDAVLTAPLPAGPDVLWRIDPAYTGQGTCSLSGAQGAQLLTCDLGDLAPQAEFSVHILSDTTTATCGPSFVTVGTLSSSNVPDVVSQDVTRVVCPASRPRTNPPTPLPVTGGPFADGLAWSLMLLVVGAGLTLGASRRRRAEA